MAPYTYFLDAAQGMYVFLQAVEYRPTRPWELPQTLYIVRPNGTPMNLGDYAFPSEDDVWERSARIAPVWSSGVTELMTRRRHAPMSGLTCLIRPLVNGRPSTPTFPQIPDIGCGEPGGHPMAHFM